MISMDGGDSEVQDPRELKELPTILELGVGEGRNLYVTSFCLGCKTPHLPANRIVHKECGGAIVLVHKEFTLPPPRTDGLPQDNSVIHFARKSVEKEIEQLNTDEGYLNDMRTKYRGFMVNWVGNKKEK